MTSFVLAAERSGEQECWLLHIQQNSLFALIVHSNVMLVRTENLIFPEIKHKNIRLENVMQTVQGHDRK
jgi:hypothetical protein